VDYFSKWGIVKDAVVMIDKNTYASRGFGFVTFELESSVDKVLREGHAIKGKYIECKRAEPKGFYGGGPSDGGMYLLDVCMLMLMLLEIMIVMIIRRKMMVMMMMMMMEMIIDIHQLA